jgi:hypothetical protein
VKCENIIFRGFIDTKLSAVDMGFPLIYENQFPREGNLFSNSFQSLAESFKLGSGQRSALRAVELGSAINGIGS